MKRLALILLVFILLFASCTKKEEEYDLDPLIIPEGTPVSIMNPHTLDVTPYTRDNAELEAFLSEYNDLTPEDITSVEYLDLEAETPHIALFVDRENNNTYVFRAWSQGEGKCAALLTMLGSNEDIYILTFESESIASHIENIYSSFEG